MNNKNELTLVDVVMFDQDTNLPKDKAVIKHFKDITITEGESPQITLLNLAVNKDIKGILAKHNEKRGKIVNSTVLERTGAEVFLKPITIEDVTVKIK